LIKTWLAQRKTIAPALWPAPRPPSLSVSDLLVGFRSKAGYCTVRSHDRSRFSRQDRRCRASANAPIDPSAASCSEPTPHGDSQRRSDLSKTSI